MFGDQKIKELLQKAKNVVADSNIAGDTVTKIGQNFTLEEIKAMSNYCMNHSIKSNATDQNMLALSFVLDDIANTHSLAGQSSNLDKLAPEEDS